MKSLMIVGWVAFAASAQSVPHGVAWTQGQKVNWNDFKGRAPRSSGEPSAVTDTGFRVQLECREEVLDIRVVAEFYRNSSWVKAGRRSGELLRHEQGHFDLTELYARKMREAVRNSHTSCEDEQAAEAAGKKLFAVLDREWSKAERQYDSETKFGTDLIRQKEALERIARELAQ